MPKKNKEKRFYEVEEIEIRSSDENEDDRFVQGIGIVYDREVEIWPGFREKIRPGAFEKSIRNQPEIKSFFNHNPNYVLSTTRSKPALILEDSKKGLRFKSPIPPTTYGNDLRVNLERKNVRGASFTFTVAPDGEILTRDEKGVLHREIVKGEIYEIGPVTNPAYTRTTASLRSEEESFNECMKRYKETRTEEDSDIDEIEIMEREIENF